MLTDATQLPLPNENLDIKRGTSNEESLLDHSKSAKNLETTRLVER